MASNWKEHHANEAARVMNSSLVEDVLTEFAGNMGFEREGLPEYGLLKIVNTVAQAARAQALGFDPELLRLSGDEANEQMVRLARIAAEQGKPVWLVEADG